METFSALLAISAENSPVLFPAQRPVTRSLMFSLISVWINDWVNNRDAGDLRRYHAHYDVIVMLGPLIVKRHNNRANNIISDHSVVKLGGWWFSVQMANDFKNDPCGLNHAVTIFVYHQRHTFGKKYIQRWGIVGILISNLLLPPIAYFFFEKSMSGSFN